MDMFLLPLLSLIWAFPKTPLFPNWPLSIGPHVQTVACSGTYQESDTNVGSFYQSQHLKR